MTCASKLQNARKVYLYKGLARVTCRALSRCVHVAYRLQLLSPERECKSPRGSNFPSVPREGQIFFKYFLGGSNFFESENFRFFF